MEDKIEVNDYVRTKDGKIGIFDRYSLRKENSLYKSHFNCFIKLRNRKSPLQCCEDYIANHSKQPIDLIEVKDLVCFKNKLQNSLENEEMIIHIFDNDTLEEVKQAIEKGEIELLEILTHEQFEANCYKVGGEDEKI